MADGTIEPPLKLGNYQVTLCDCLNEIFEVIWCNFLNKDSENSKQRLKLSITLKKKSQEAEESIDVFTFTVRCNQEMPFTSRLNDLYPSSLCQFASNMQTYQQESHLIICTSDDKDPTVTKKFVLWVSSRDGKDSCLKTQQENLMNRNLLMDDAFLLQLRVFMKSSVMSKEIHSISSLLCCVKMLNPMVDICFSVDGICGVDLQLCHKEHFQCDSLIFSSDPTVYHYSNLSGADDHDTRCVPDVSKLSCTSVKSKDVSITSGEEGNIGLPLSSLLFLPRNCSSSSTQLQEEEKALMEKQGVICIQVFDSKRLPMDMLQFCKHFQTSADYLIPWENLKAIKKSHGICTPYNTGCYVSTIAQAQPPHVMKACDKFTIWLCLVLENNIFDSYSTTTTNNDVLRVLKKIVSECFDKLFQPKSEETKPLTLKNTSDQQGHDVQRWIPDIADSLADIFMRSTCVDFRTELVQMIPVNNCAGLKSFLNNRLSQILIDKNVHGVMQPSTQSVEITANPDGDIDFNPKHLSAPGDNSESSMSPDSLELIDQDWLEMRDDMEMTDQDLVAQKCFSECGVSYQKTEVCFLFSEPMPVATTNNNPFDSEKPENSSGAFDQNGNGIEQMIKDELSVRETYCEKISDSREKINSGASRMKFKLQTVGCNSYEEHSKDIRDMTGRKLDYQNDFDSKELELSQQELRLQHAKGMDYSFLTDAEDPLLPENTCDDWYDREEFENWCAEMLQ